MMGLTPYELKARTRLLLRRAVLTRLAREPSDYPEGELARVEAALRRMDDGRYGICERCLQTIGAQTLLTEPASSLCAECVAHRQSQ